jgi:murein DD-endopeptidase MepM/ murein hydrolase activator NlpD
VLEAQQRVAAAQEKLTKLQADWAAAEPVIAEAQKRLDEANAALKQTQQGATGNGGWTWPTYGVLTSGYGKRNLKVNAYHDGLDIANEENTPIGAARAGVVAEAGWCKGYGFCVKINHGSGFTSEYGHLASEPLVKAGEQVAAGTIIGLMGTTYDESHGGYSTGVHLHFTIRSNGHAVDPLSYLP